MKIFLITFIFLILYVENSYAIPISTLVIWADFFLFLIPALAWFLLTVLLYFRKYIFHLNMLLLFTAILFYFIHSHVTWVFIYNIFELLLFILIFLVLIVFKSKVLEINYFVFLWVLFLNIFLFYSNVHIFKFYSFWECMEGNMYSSFLVEHIDYKQNFIEIHAMDSETTLWWYVVIWRWDEVSHCMPKWVYNVCTWWSRWIWERLSTLSYYCLDRNSFSTN